MKTVLITGANRGLGLEFAKQYQLDEWKVIACCRNPDDVPELLESGVSVSQLNLLDFEAINRFAETLKGKPIDLLINNAGIHDRSKEEGFLGIETEHWIDGFKVNAMAPVLLTQALVDNLSASENPVAATIGSQAGCLTLYDSGGLYLYRTSKAAAHSATVILSNDLKTLGIPYVCLRPGHTKTDMGGSDAPHEIDESVRMMRQTLAKVDISKTGCFIDRTGELIPWNMEKDLNI